MARQGVAEVERVDPVLGHDVLRESGHIPILEILHDPVAVWSRHRAPIRRAAEVRDRREDVEGVASRRGERGVGRGGAVQVEGEVLRERLRAEHLIEEPAIARPHQDLVVRDVLVRAVRPEVDDHQRHRILHPVDLPVRVLPAPARRDQPLIGEGDVAVAHHRIGGQRLPAREPDPVGLPGALVDGDLLDRRVEAELAPEVREAAHETIHERARAAHREPDPPLLLEVVDQRVDRGRFEGVPAHQQRVEREDLLQPLVADVLVREPRDRAIGSEPDQVGEHLHHVEEARERLVDEPHPRREDSLRLAHESAVARDIIRVQGLDLPDDRLAVPVVPEDGAVLEPNLIEGVDGHDRDVVRGPLPRGREDLINQPGGRDDRRPAIEGEAVLPVHVGAATGLVPLLQHGDLMPLGAEANGRRESPESAADDENAHSG